MRHLALLATAATVALTTLPASAQMRTSAPKAPAAATAVTGAIAETGVRPTRIGGTERAQVLTPGSVIFGINAGSVSAEYGLMENLELDVNALVNPGLTIAPAFGLTGGLNAGVGAKYIFLNSNSMSIGVNGGLGLGLNLATGGASTNLNVGLPISLWMGKSALHIEPGFGSTAAGSTFGSMLAYERELNSKWRLFVSDNLQITNAGAINNTLGGGVRVAFTPNLTVDVGMATGNLNINPIGIGVQATLFTFGANFGAKSIDELRGLFGI
jgi:hypothetical protein